MPEGITSGGVAVLVPAAGAGARMGGERKQFRLLGGKPLLEQTVLAFESHPEVDHIVIAAPEDVVQNLDQELRASGVRKLAAVVAGGRTRQESVRRAIEATPAGDTVLLVHDAVRPFVQPEEISAVIAAVREYGAAAPAIAVADTVRRAAEDCFLETISRADLYRMQTPQGFRRDWLERAHANAGSIEATDDVELVQQLGHRVRIVPGSSLNIKITTPADWVLARAIWESGVLEANP